jgi:methionyl-tRNA formyltransferase
MRFKIVNVISDSGSWINRYLPSFISQLKEFSQQVNWFHDLDQPENSDITFYLSFSKIVSTELLQRSRHNLVVHESLLPEGKGWSPLTWQILEGKNTIPITLFEAEEKVDNGKIYLQDFMVFEGGELIGELREKQAEYTFKLGLQFLIDYEMTIKNAIAQKGPGSFYKRRTPKDSQLNTDSTLKELFNLLRVVDNEKYPAFFEHLGSKYQITVQKVKGAKIS